MLQSARQVAVKSRREQADDQMQIRSKLRCVDFSRLFFVLCACKRDLLAAQVFRRVAIKQHFCLQQKCAKNLRRKVSLFEFSHCFHYGICILKLMANF